MLMLLDFVVVDAVVVATDAATLAFVDVDTGTAFDSTNVVTAALVAVDTAHWYYCFCYC